jgi:hypothetical protein
MTIFEDDISFFLSQILSPPVRTYTYMMHASVAVDISKIRSYKKSVLRDIDLRFRSVLSFCIWHQPRPISNVKFFKYDFEFPKIFDLKLPHTLGAGQSPDLRCG